MQPESLHDLERLHRTYRPALVRYFTRQTGNPAEAEDLTQEVFVRLARSSRSTAASAEAYLFRVATNLVRDRARREKVRGDYRASVGAVEGLHIDSFDPHRVAAGREAVRSVHDWILDLPEKTRRIFILYRLENLDRKDIADRLGLSRSSVDKHIAKAMGLLIDRIGEVK